MTEFFQADFLSRLQSSAFQQLGVLPEPSLPGIHAPVPSASAHDHAPIRSASVETGSSSVPSSLQWNLQWDNHLECSVETPGVANSRLVGGTSVVARSLWFGKREAAVF